MAIAAALCVAVAANAATVTWGADWVYSYTGVEPASGDLYNAGTTAGTAWLLLLPGTSSSGVSLDNSMTITGGSVVDTRSMAGSGGYPSFDTIGASFANGQYYAVVIYDSDTGLYGVSDARQLTDLAGDPPTGTLLSLSNGAGYGNSGEFALTLTPVPEPASMALFGIGAGVLALRRRFKSKKA